MSLAATLAATLAVSHRPPECAPLPEGFDQEAFGEGAIRVNRGTDPCDFYRIPPGMAEPDIPEVEKGRQRLHPAD